MTISAAIFDIGGVLTTSPVQSIRAFEREAGLSSGPLGAIMADPDGPWSAFETSSVTREGFIDAFEKAAAEEGLEVDGEAFLAAFVAGMAPRPEFLAVVEGLRGRLKLGCITNNVAGEGDQRPDRGFDIYELFDVVIESAKVGVRKPDPRIYEMACQQLGVPLNETVFLDDFGVNLKGARALGITTIKVDDTLAAIEELERVLGWAFPRDV